MPDDIQTQIRMNCGDIYLKKGNSYLISLPDQCNIDLDPHIAKSVIDELRTDERFKKRFKVSDW